MQGNNFKHEFLLIGATPHTKGKIIDVTSLPNDCLIIDPWVKSVFAPKDASDNWNKVLPAAGLVEDNDIYRCEILETITPNANISSTVRFAVNAINSEAPINQPIRVLSKAVIWGRSTTCGTLFTLLGGRMTAGILTKASSLATGPIVLISLVAAASALFLVIFTAIATAGGAQRRRIKAEADEEARLNAVLATNLQASRQFMPYPDLKDYQKYDSPSNRARCRALASVHEILVTAHTIETFNHYSMVDLYTASKEDANHTQIIDAGIVDILIQKTTVDPCMFAAHLEGMLCISDTREINWNKMIINLTRSFNLPNYLHRTRFLYVKHSRCVSRFGTLSYIDKLKSHISKATKTDWQTQANEITFDLPRPKRTQRGRKQKQKRTTSKQQASTLPKLDTEDHAEKHKEKRSIRRRKLYPPEKYHLYAWPTSLRGAYWEKSTRYPRTSQYHERLRKESIREYYKKKATARKNANKSNSRRVAVRSKTPESRDPSRDPCGFFVQKRKPLTFTKDLLEPRSDQAQPNTQIRTPRLSIPASALSAREQSSMTLRDEKKGSAPAIFKKR